MTRAGNAASSGLMRMSAVKPTIFGGLKARLEQRSKGACVAWPQPWDFVTGAMDQKSKWE